MPEAPPNWKTWNLAHMAVYGIATKYLYRELSEYHAPGTAAAVRRYCDRFREMRSSGTGIAFIGISGAGKTMLLQVLLRTLLVENFPMEGYYFSLEKACELITGALANADKQAERDTKLFQPQVLCLDDIDSLVNKSRRPEEILELILRTRMAAGKVTCLATRKDMPQHGKEVQNLLKEAVIPVMLPDEDFRNRYQILNQTKLFS